MHSTKEHYFTTSRLLLRRWKNSDQAPFIALNNDEKVMEHFERTFTADETKGAIIRFNDHLDTYGYSYFAAELISTGAFIGFIGFTNTKYNTPVHPCRDIGWRLDKNYWGNGYATEGALGCLKYAFETLELEEMHSFTAKTNKPSERVMQKIGMTKVGSFGHPMVSKDHPVHDHWIYHIDAKTFASQKL